MQPTMRPFVPKMLAALAFVSAMTLLSNTALAQTLSSPVGACWSFNANGYAGYLCIPSVDASGNLVGAYVVFDGTSNPIQGFWDQNSQAITFIRIIAPNDPTVNQIYTGYVFPTAVGNPASFSMAGYAEVFQGTGGSPERHLLGWTAKQR